MPARSIVADHATFRDLNIFEERLRENAAGLQRRKSRYQLFLAQLLAVIALLLAEVLLSPDVFIVSTPYNSLLRWLLPDVYTSDTFVILNPYFTTGLLFVSVTTLVLFFASGMYSEKIAYANKYVPHTNRTLRSFNMYFNTRKPPLRSKVLWNPLDFLFPRPTSNTSTSSRSPSPPPSHSQQQPSSSGHTRSQSGSRPIPSIPPATNPRGELIFSSRVDKPFREGYDRYRLAFEKKREEVIRQINERKRIERWWWIYKLPFRAPPPPPSSPRPSSTAAGADTSIAPGYSRNNSQSSSRGRGTPRSGTPPSTPGTSSPTTATRQRDKSGSPMSRQHSLRSSGGGQRRNPLSRRVTPDGGGSNSNLDRGGGVSASSAGRLRELGEEGDMRMRALERSWAQGSPNPSP